MPDRAITVIKKDIHQVETWRYQGTILHENDHSIILEAFFNRPDTPFHGIQLCEGDRFVESYYKDRWYNIFAIYDRDDGHLKGWYCNLSYPAEINDGVVSYIDLALDLLVYPDGRQMVLDQEEYDALSLPIRVRHQADLAFQELRKLNFRDFIDLPV